MKKQRICEFCNEVFEITNSYMEKRYCSLDCYHSYRRQEDKDKRHNIICSFCGKEFSALKSKKNRKFCSNDCRKSFDLLANKNAMEERVCKFCEKKFLVTPSKTKRKFCSKECWYSFRKAIEQQIVCKECGKIFISKKKGIVPKYCSLECHNNYKYRKSLKFCKFCGREFHASNARVFCSDRCKQQMIEIGYLKRGSSIEAKPCANCGMPVQRAFSKNRKGEDCDKIFCSRDCYDTYRTIIVLERTRECLHCGKSFIGDVRGQKFCSNKCAFEDRKPDLKICPICGDEFLPTYVDPNGEIKHPSNRKFCSKECVYENYRINEDRKQKISLAFRGENHPNWKGGGLYSRGADWAEVKSHIRERDVYCQHCEKTKEESLIEYGSQLEVHHIVPYRCCIDYVEANNYENLILLCKSCHQHMEAEFNRGCKESASCQNTKN